MAHAAGLEMVARLVKVGLAEEGKGVVVVVVMVVMVEAAGLEADMGADAEMVVVPGAGVEPVGMAASRETAVTEVVTVVVTEAEAEAL